MKRIIKNISCLLFVLSLLPVLSGCDNEDDLIEIFAGKTWKLSRLTTKDSSQRFLPNLWNNEKDYNSSMDALNKENTFTLNFEGSELDGELMGTTFTARGINATVTGTWKADGKDHTFSLYIEHTTGSESDALAKAFIAGLQNIYKYEGDASSLTLFYKDGQKTNVMGFSHR
ncbi:DUF4847 family protein [Bacteroides sp.]|uniref:DUF4847 family protein n=1 Tax=Bacteroides sp. TaxID=29523 RepID=UPI003AB58ADA